MQSPKKSYYFRADANALGGFLEKPFEKIIPTLAPVSLPAVGGFATARSEAFTLDEIVGCSSAYTRVSGRENPKDEAKDQAEEGSVSILVTAVVEDLNILEVVTARRIVAQVSIWVPGPDSQERPKFSLLGSRFEGLKLAGHDRRPKPYPQQQPDQQQQQPPPPQSGEGGRADPLTWPDVQRIRLARAGEPAKKNHRWVTSDLSSEKGDDKFCLLVDGFEDTGPCKVKIPGFGLITLGELLITPDSVRLVALRADLGCPVTGGASVAAVGGGGGHNL